MLAHQPLVFYFAQRYGTAGTHDGMAIFDTMWDTYRDFRDGMHVTITYGPRCSSSRQVEPR